MLSMEITTETNPDERETQKDLDTRWASLLNTVCIQSFTVSLILHHRIEHPAEFYDTPLTTAMGST